MRLFITGGTGYLGGALLRQALAAGHQVGASYFSQAPATGQDVLWAPLDIRDQLAVEETLDRFRPDLVIHTAFRQSDPDLDAITASGAGVVAAATAAIQSGLIHMSSDVIFDGERDSAYSEEDQPSPITPYGAAKARAEALVAAEHSRAAIVRTSLIYGFDPLDRQTRFALEVAAGKRGDQLFSDEYRCPIYVEDLAAALLELATGAYSGVLHIAGAESVSRYDLGVLMARACGVDPSALRPALSRTSALRRPRNCRLAIGRAQGLLGTPLRGVRAVLDDLGRLH